MDRSFYRFVTTTRVTDRQTDKFSSLDRVCFPCSAVKMVGYLE